MDAPRTPETPRLIAGVQLLGQSPRGGSSPLYIRCETMAGRSVMLVKVASAQTGISERQLCLDLAGNRIAASLGLVVATPAVVRLSDEVITQVRDQHAIEVSSQWAVGVDWEQDVLPFIPRTDLRLTPEGWARTLLALDLVLANPNRTLANPNIGWLRAHPLVFNFVGSLDLQSSDAFAHHLGSLAGLRRNHLLSSRVSSQLPERVSEVLESLPHSWLGTVRPTLPNEWHPYWREIVEYLGQLRTRSAAFVDAVREET